MQKNFYLFLFITCLIASALTSLNAQSWIGPWTDRRPVTISNPGATVLTNYQVKITLTNSTFNFNDAKNDGSDIRLTTSDGTTLIPFWIEEWNYGTQATIWVKVPSIPVAGTTIYLYYGNNAATNAGNGATTFDFFDDFESWALAPSNAWQDKAPLPTPIADQTSAVYNNKLYSIGGYGNGPNDPQNKNYEYDPANNTWAEKAPMPTARWGMIAVEFNGLIYVFGGSISSAAGSTKNEVYDPTLNTWTTKADIPSALGIQGTMAVKYGDKIHLFNESSHFEYDPVNDSYISKANVPKPRFWCTNAVVGSKIYLIGGTQDGIIATNDNQEYDPATDSWAIKAPLPTIRWGATRENPVINGKIYVTHGLDGTRGTFHTENYAYDPATNTWEEKGPAAHRRDGVGCGVINNKFYVVGGRTDFVGPYGLTYNEVYDPSLDTWTPQPDPTGFTQWTTSGPTYVFADPSAKYRGNFGLVVQQTSNDANQHYAQTLAGFGDNYALDFNWQITDAGGIVNDGSGLIKPQGVITLTNTDPTGSIYFYDGNQDGEYVPVVRWFNGSGFNHLQNSSWNSWHNVTVVRNGAGSKVIFDGNQYQSLAASPLSGGTGQIKFGVIYATKQYIDNVRVRQWAGGDPSSSVGVPEVLPVELFSFTSNLNGRNISLVWETMTEKNSDKFTVERKTVGSNWETIGSVKAAVLSNSPKQYSYSDNKLQSGKYQYRLKMIDNDGTFEYSKIIEAEISIPMNFELSQNYPNPFNPSTKIDYNLPFDSKVTLEIYNVMGEKVGQLVNQDQSAGYFSVEFNSSSLGKSISSGIYFYRITALDRVTGKDYSAIKKLILLK